MMQLRSRYPGLRPFDAEEQHNFFGRTEEIEAVCRLLDLDKLLVLHGPSGMGKSSLINAGILPALSNVRRWDIPYHIVPIRFTNYDPQLARARRQNQGTGLADTELIKDPIERFVEACVGPDSAWPEVIPMPKESFWLRTKEMLVDLEMDPLRVVFVLDQFEELFTYPEGRVAEFAGQLAELYHQVQPESVRRGLARREIMEAEEEDDIPLAPKIAQLIERLETPLDLKILISMRSDKLHFLERLRPYIPEMMLNSFELRSFAPEQAKRAIAEPALLDGAHFISPQFTIDPVAMADIMGFLEDKLTRRIDPSQLQIICQHIEQQMIAREKRQKKIRASI